MIHEAIAKSEIEIKYVAGMDILAGALTKALGGVKLGKFAKGTWSKVDGLGMELGRHWTWDVEDKVDICFGIAFSFVLFAVFEFSFILLHSLSFWEPWATGGVLTKGFSQQAIETSAGT
jgi:hypothetical protein